MSDRTDTERLDWLARHGAEIRKFTVPDEWAVWSKGGDAIATTLREAIDIAMDTEPEEAE